MSLFLATIFSVILISLVSLIGIFTLSFKQILVQKTLLLLISFAIGALLGNAFFHLLPESFEQIPQATPYLTIVGIIIFFILEKILRWRHCHKVDCRKHKTHLTVLNLTSDAVHNFIDGVIIAASYTVSLPLGITTSLAIMLHEVPQEIGDFAILVHGGFSPKKALFFNFVSALFALLGAIIFLSFGSKVEILASLLLPFTAGGFIYVAASDLVPELHQETKIFNSVMQLVLIVLGIGLMIVLKTIT